MDPNSNLLYVATTNNSCKIISVDVSTGGFGANSFGSGSCAVPGVDGATPSFTSGTKYAILWRNFCVKLKESCKCLYIVLSLPFIPQFHVLDSYSRRHVDVGLY